MSAPNLIKAWAMKIHWAKFSRSLLLIASSSALSLSPLSGVWAAEPKSLPDYMSEIADSSYLEKSSQGDARVVLPEALPVRLDLSGEDGRDGRDGAKGTSGFCYGSGGTGGGNGGSGEDGEDGRDGESMVVIYRSLADLSQVFVVSEGGKGGKGGRGGSGGSGCSYCPPERQTPDVEIDLPDPSGIKVPGNLGLPDNIQIPSNIQVPNLNQDKDKGDCTQPSSLLEISPKGSGACVTTSSGIRGSDGRSGKDGKIGHLYLAEQGAGIRPAQPTQGVRLSAFAQNEALLLSKNLWDSRQGALALLAPGSVIADEYYEYGGRLEQNYVLAWDAPQPPTDFPNEEVQLTLMETGEVEMVSSENVWLASQVSAQNGATQVAIKQIVKQEDVTQLALTDFSGQRSDLSLTLIDQARKSDILTTQFRLQYRVARDLQTDRPSGRSTGYVTRYEGEVPAELVQQDRQRFILNLGHLPIDSRYLQSGLNVEVELTAVRTLGDRSAEQRVVWRGKVES